jgi:hypothetical protein
MKTLTDHEYEQLLAKAKDYDRLHTLINTPELVDFPHAVHLEAIHQEERWGRQDRESKVAIDWFWLVGYLAGRALEHDREGDRLTAEATGLDTGASPAFYDKQIAHHREKAVHHTITTAAALNHWHAGMLRKARREQAGGLAANSDVAPLLTEPMPLASAG